MKNAFSCLLVILCSFFNAFCQPAARPLTVGDAVPDYLIRNLVNYKTPTARLSDFKEKLLILDFMATSCGGCMYHLFRIDSLEPAYKDKLQVLPVSYETKAKLLSVLRKPFAGKKISSPFVAQDSVLRSWFPHQFVSHMVWIHNGIVKAITKPEYVKAANIEAVLRNEVIRWPVKKDVGHYNPATPLLIPNGEVLTPVNQLFLKYYSTLPAYMDGYGYTYGLYVDTVNDLQRNYAINESILRLYLNACGKPFTFLPSSIILDVADTGRFVFNGQGYRNNWRVKNYYCYEATFPLFTSKAVIGERMRTDLNFYLQLDGHLEKWRMRCMVARPAPLTTLVSAPPSDSIIQLSGLVQRLNQVYGGIPFFNEVPGSDGFYVEKPTSADIPALRKILLQHGVDLIEEEREIEVLVITDKVTRP